MRSKRGLDLPPLSSTGLGSNGPRSLPKIYPRLQTLSQLTNVYVHDLHTGDFVARSQLRWQSFDGVKTPNSARDRTVRTVKDSAALVIQCSWRRRKAERERERRKSRVWRRQLEIAAKITHHSSSLAQALEVMGRSTSDRLQAVANFVSIRGFYFFAPAQLLAWWLMFICAQVAVKRILRRPRIIARAVDVPVKLTLDKLVQLWRLVTSLAVLTLQFCVRAFLARRKVGKRRLEHLQLEAARKLQGFIRVYNARHVARRLRRWCATVRLQCCWRCYAARERVRRRRVTWVATRVCTPLLLQAIRQATVKLRERSARTIQKQFRGCRARFQFRELLSRHEQQKWRRNPSKGLDCFQLQRYDQAALYLENCFRQGIYAEEITPSSVAVRRGQKLTIKTPSKMVSGSRMSFSFSTAPTGLGSDWVLHRNYGEEEEDDVGHFAERLQFWQAYAISHFRVYEATGNVFNLKQARVGWESYLKVGQIVQSWIPFQAIADLRFRSQFGLVKCLFWSGKEGDKDAALNLSLSLLQSISLPDSANVEAQLLMISAMLYFEQKLLAASCNQLEKLLGLSSQTAFSDVEVRFTLALMLLRCYEKSFEASNEEDTETETLLRTATQLLKQCYRVVELWPSVGFYHGCVKKSETKRLLAKERVGAFLLHREHQSDKMVLQVKLSERIASLRIEFTASGVYKTRKMADHLGHFSLHGLVANLPPEAGVQMDLGLRKPLYARTLRKKLEQSQPNVVEEKMALRSRLLNWNEWERKLNETAAALRFSDTGKGWKRRNETWSTLCFEMAKALECSGAWVFAEFLAFEALQQSKDRSQRANVNFLAGRVANNMQKRNESTLFFQQARLEMGCDQSRPSFLRNLTAIQRALSWNVAISKQESFSSRLERLETLERLCLKAWRYDSLALRFCGDPFRESLLLQRVADEMYAECGDTFFIRSLLKAHVRAHVTNDSWFEGLHLKCAYTCVAQLLKRFQEHQGSWSVRLENLADHLQEKPQGKNTKRIRTFNVKLLLLSWHHMPFVLCFEMAEVLYRYKNHSFSTLIDVYESLQGRLRGSQAQTCAYAAYEELILLRLAFIHAGKVSQMENSWRHFDSAICCISEILELRKTRSPSEAVKSIKWPCSIRLPFSFSDAEVFFIRGFFQLLREEIMKVPIERRSSWRDFHALHQELIALVMKSAPGEVSGRGGRMLNSVRYRADNLQSLRIFVGATHDVSIGNMLRSQPFVAVRLEGQTKPTRSAPTWTNLSPSWEEEVEIPASSSRANVTISIMNRTRRNSRWQDADTIGSVSMSMWDLLAAHDGVTEGKYYELTLVKPSEQQNKKPRIFLSFQVIAKPQPILSSSMRRTATWATRSGNWDVEDVRAHLNGDLRVFVSNRWIWSRFGAKFREEKDLLIAKWFWVKSVRLTSELQRRTSQIGVRLNTSDALAVAMDLVGLSRCYRANLGDAKWRDQAVPLLGQAEAILLRKTAQLTPEHCSLSDHTLLEKELSAVRKLLTEARGTSVVGPLEEALARKTPATSEWIKITNGGETRYFNQDTGEIFHSDWRSEPLEYEDKELLLMEEERLPHRIVILTTDMKARVSFYRQELTQLHAQDPFQWVAVFNDRKKQFQFYSPHSSAAYSDSSGVSSQPPTYVMLADEFLLYHVLLVQDSYRKYRCRRRRQQRARGVLLSVYGISRVLAGTRRRIALKWLNCVRVVVEKAQHLRAADLFSSDPFVKLTLTDASGEVVATGETGVRYNSLNPKWNEEFHFRYSFIEHERQQTTGRSREATLTLKVLDYDVVTVGKKKKKKNGLAEEKNEEGEVEKSDCGDFLGLVTIPVQNFIHGKRMTADLPLLDEQGGNSSSGFLTVSVHWTHCDEEEDNESKLWAIGSGGGWALKKGRNRAEVPQEAARELDTLRHQTEQLLDLLLSTATEVLGPVLRLQSRLNIAQTQGKTAEEAKMLEQRFNGLVQMQLLPRLKLLRDQVAQELDVQLPLVLKNLFGPAEDYNSRVKVCLDKLDATMSVLKVYEQGISPLEAVALALDQHRHVIVWNVQFRELLDTFFIGDNAQWQFPVQEKVDEVYAVFAGDSRPDGGKTAKRPATAAIAKRKERIERAKQEKAWYEL
ncbi:Unconventional myosin-Va [Phytophthora citrophthora]|uniref:Unconventional myosin-Va n=1 Tax=Phytophthora citrophthora TaxID=4793 RepID=A0AAD9G9P3_9STRA|nr:Unconventional myosin-Va [Phytophthora citrophthora]